MIPIHDPSGLAQNRYFDDPSFISYIKYLEYWRQPQYAKYLRWDMEQREGGKP